MSKRCFGDHKYCPPLCDKCEYEKECWDHAELPWDPPHFVKGRKMYRQWCIEESLKVRKTFWPDPAEVIILEENPNRCACFSSNKWEEKCQPCEYEADCAEHANANVDMEDITGPVIVLEESQ